MQLRERLNETRLEELKNTFYLGKRGSFMSLELGQRDGSKIGHTGYPRLTFSINELGRFLEASE